jgi:hypothetical protein
MNFFGTGFIHLRLTIQFFLWISVNCISLNGILCRDVFGNLQFK